MKNMLQMAAFISFIAPGMALAGPQFPSGFRGVWVTPTANCESAKQGEGDGDWMTIAKDDVRGYEWGCDLKSAKPMPDKSLNVKLACGSEGDEYTSASKYTLVVPFFHTSKCRGGPVEKPSLPTRAMTSPAVTC